MKKTLRSGLVVEDTQYHQLLDKKDNWYGGFRFFCDANNIPHCINLMTEEEYNLALKWANIK